MGRQDEIDKATMLQSRPSPVLWCLVFWAIFSCLLAAFYRLVDGPPSIQDKELTWLCTYPTIACAAIAFSVVLDLSSKAIIADQSKPHQRAQNWLKKLYLLIIVVAGVANYLMSIGWSSKFTSPYGKDTYIVRWAEFSTLGPLMTVLTEVGAGDCPCQCKWICKSAARAGLQLLTSCIIAVIGFGSTSVTQYWICTSISLTLFAPNIFRVLTSYRRMNTSIDVLTKTEKDDIELYLARALVLENKWRMFLLTVVEIFFWLLFVLIHFLGEFGGLSARQTFLADMVFDVSAKMGYSSIMFRFHEYALNPKLDLQHQIKAIIASRNKVTMFLRYLGHEVRVPLQSLALGIDSLADKPEPDTQDMIVNMMSTSVSAMSEVLNDCLLLQKTEAGLNHINKDQVFMKPLLEDAIKLFSPSAKQKNVTISLTIGAGIPASCILDARVVKSGLKNYLSNAIKFSKASTEIQVSCSTQQGTSGVSFLHFAVKDQGIGISESDQTRLFTEFTQINPEKNQQGKGTGLGLSLVRALVMSHGGKVGIESAPNQGSTFFLMIPLIGAGKDCLSESTKLICRSVLESPTIEQKILIKKRPKGMRLKKKAASVDVCVDRVPGRVLVVDDISSNRKLLAKLVDRRMGIDADMADSGVLCLKMLKEATVLDRPYTLVLLDYMMPGMSGPQTVAALRQDPAFKDLRVIGLTGNTMQKDIDTFIQAGANAVLGKPISIKKLQTCLRGLE